MNRLQLTVVLAIVAGLSTCAAGKTAPTTLQSLQARIQRGSGGEIVGVDLGRSGVSDDDLAILKPLAGLRWLGLARTSISDRGLAHLKGLANLELLDLPAPGSPMTVLSICPA